MSKKKPAYVDGKFVGDTLSISVKPHYQKEYEFLKAHHNRSGLICELVRQYIEGGGMSIGYQQPYQPVATQPVSQSTPQQKEEVKKDKVEDNKQEIKEFTNSKPKEKEENKQVPIMAMPSFLNG